LNEPFILELKILNLPLKMDQSKNDEEVLRTLDDLEMMRRPHLWPTPDTLCLKNPRLVQESGWPSFAVLYFDSEGYYFLPELDKKKAREGGDELLRELIEEGWLVD
jgi:hypothetical protein